MEPIIKINDFFRYSICFLYLHCIRTYITCDIIYNIVLFSIGSTADLQFKQNIRLPPENFAPSNFVKDAF